MNVLLIYPKSPRKLSIGYEDRIIRLASKRAYSPPLGLLTVAALLPQDWNLRLVDLTFQTITEEDWNWCEVVFTTGTLPQFTKIIEVIRESKKRGKIVAVGGAAAFVPCLPVRAEPRILADEGGVGIDKIIVVQGHIHGNAEIVCQGPHPRRQAHGVMKMNPRHAQKPADSQQFRILKGQLKYEAFGFGMNPQPQTNAMIGFRADDQRFQPVA